jgi:flagellar basal body P-ring formation protein FlgA
MKQASNSLLTFNPTPFTASSAVPALPRGKAGTNPRHLTPFNIYWKSLGHFCPILPDLSCSLRSIFRSWLGEGRIRSLFYGIYGVLLVVSAIAFFNRDASGADSVAISLKEEASIQSATILLKDVADLQGSDLHAIERFSNISLGASPEFGSVKILSRHQIDESMQAAVGPIRDTKFSGAAAVQVRMKGKAIDPGEIASLLKTYILKTTSWKESEIEVHSIGNLNGIEMPPDNAELRFSSADAVMGRQNLTALLEIMRAGKPLRCFWVTARIVIHTDIWVATQRILPGQMVESSNFVKKSTAIEDLRSTYIRSLDEVVGKIARRSFSPGDLIIREAFAEPFLIKRGETVQLRLQRSGMLLTSQARAEQDGILGQIIRVRNLDFPTVLKAQVTGRSQVMLQ